MGKSNFHIYNFSAPDKNPQNIRVQASQPKEMIIKWEVRILYVLLITVVFFLLFLGPHAKYNDRTISFKNRRKLLTYFINIFYLYILKSHHD